MHAQQLSATVGSLTHFAEDSSGTHLGYMAAVATSELMITCARGPYAGLTSLLKILPPCKQYFD